MAFFLGGLLLLAVGALIHTFADRKPERRTRFRVVEIWLLWFVAGGGVLTAFGGFSHIGPGAHQVAETIGYAPSMFQWEVGWADIAFGVVGFLTIWNRGSFLTAAVITPAIFNTGATAGHIMQWVAHDNTDPDNIWAIPGDIIPTVVSIVLLIVYRRLGGPKRAPSPGGS